MAPIVPGILVWMITHVHLLQEDWCRACCGACGGEGAFFLNLAALPQHYPENFSCVGKGTFIKVTLTGPILHQKVEPIATPLVKEWINVNAT